MGRGTASTPRCAARPRATMAGPSHFVAPEIVPDFNASKALSVPAVNKPRPIGRPSKRDPRACRGHFLSSATSPQPHKASPNCHCDRRCQRKQTAYQVLADVFKAPTTCTATVAARRRWRGPARAQASHAPHSPVHLARGRAQGMWVPPKSTPSKRQNLRLPTWHTRYQTLLSSKGQSSWSGVQHTLINSRRHNVGVSLARPVTRSLGFVIPARARVMDERLKFYIRACTNG